MAAHCLRDPGAVCGAGDAVEDGCGQHHLGIEALVAVHHRRGGACQVPRVHDQQHGRAQPLGHLRRRAVVGGALAAVVQTHAALDDGDVGVAGGDGGVEGGEAAVATQHPPANGGKMVCLLRSRSGRCCRHTRRG